MKRGNNSFEYLMQVIFIALSVLLHVFYLEQDDRNHEKQSLKNRDQSKMKSQNLCLKDNT